MHRSRTVCMIGLSNNDGMAFNTSLLFVRAFINCDDSKYMAQSLLFVSRKQHHRF